MEKLYTVSENKTQKLIMAKFRLKLKKVGSQEIPGVTGKFGLKVQNKEG